MSEADGDDEIVFLIKNPSKSEDNFKLTVSLESTLADVQRLLSELYEGKPAPERQTVSIRTGAACCLTRFAGGLKVVVLAVDLWRKGPQGHVRARQGCLNGGEP